MAAGSTRSEPFVPPLDLAFRVGITGKRYSPEAPPPPQVEHQIKEVLRHVAATMVELGKERAADVYHHEGNAAIRPKLRAVTPLAEGADQIFGRVAKSLGYELDVPLPFERADYVSVFDEKSRADFDAFMGVEGAPDEKPYLLLDGSTKDDEIKNRSYEAVGHIVVYNCDLLVAVWDGHDAQGRGGTGDIVEFAFRFGHPIWWIDAGGSNPPRLIRTIAEWRTRKKAPEGLDAVRELTATIRKLVRPFVETPLAPATGVDGEVVHRRAKSGPISLAAQSFRERRARRAREKAARHLPAGSGAGVGQVGLTPFDPILIYQAEVPQPKRRLWRAYDLFFRIVGGPPPPYEEEAKTPPSFWKAQYEAADNASVSYRNRYRSSYVLVFLLATLAVIFANVPLLLHDLWRVRHTIEWTATTFELAALLGILAIVGVNMIRDWQDRWISYRLLAELCRKQEVLSMLGWSQQPADLLPIGDDAAPAPWVGWYFNALLRAAPFTTGRLTGDRLEEIKKIACATLVGGQVKYHEDRKTRCNAAARRFQSWGEGAFIGVLLLIGLKFALVLFGHETSRWVVLGTVFLSAAAAVLSAFSAALIGIGSYSEVELLEHQSKRLADFMRKAEQRLKDIDIARPLASQDLAFDLYEISKVMLQDIGGWADLFGLKVVGPS